MSRPYFSLEKKKIHSYFAGIPVQKLKYLRPVFLKERAQLRRHPGFDRGCVRGVPPAARGQGHLRGRRHQQGHRFGAALRRHQPCQMSQVCAANSNTCKDGAEYLMDNSSQKSSEQIVKLAPGTTFFSTLTSL